MLELGEDKKVSICRINWFPTLESGRAWKLDERCNNELAINEVNSFWR